MINFFFNKKSILAFNLLTILSTISISNSFAVDLRFASITQLAEQEVARIVLPQIYQRINKTVEITPLPASRAQYEANAGIKDGEAMRIYSYSEQTPNVIRVPTPYYALSTAVFALKSSNIQVNNKVDLKNFRIGKVRGVKHTDKITKGLSKVYDSPYTENLFKQLVSGSVDIALTNYQDGLLAIKKFGFEDIVVVNQSIAYEPLYHYLHKKHHRLVKPLDDALKQLKTSGELDKMITQAENLVY